LDKRVARDAIDGAYELAIRRLRHEEQREVAELLKRMQSATQPGQDFSILRHSASKLGDDAVQRCERAIPELVSVHLSAGERDVTAITEALQARLIDIALREYPGTSLFSSVRGGPAVVAAGHQVGHGERVRFEGRVRSLRGAVKDHVVRAQVSFRAAEMRSDAGVMPEPAAALARARAHKLGILDSAELCAADFALPGGLLGRSVIVRELDHFAALNGRRGAQVVDRQILTPLQQLLSGAVQGYGYAYAASDAGEQMLVFLPNASLRIASAIACELLITIRTRAFDVAGTRVPVTASFGIASAEGLAGEELVELAGKARRYARDNGKNCVALWRAGAAELLAG
jgi:GGDEF domain-containing protein